MPEFLRGRLWPAILWTVLVIVALSIPTQSLSKSDLLEWDKAAHFVLFFVLTWLWLHGAARTSRTKGLLVVLMACAFAFLTEYYQEMLGFRSKDMLDAVADSAGALVAGAVWWWETRRRDA
ncbi:MAG: VanZ family protein [Rhodothermales bacterium]